MKVIRKITALIIILILSFSIVIGQIIGNNNIDANENRIGKWHFYLDENLNTITDSINFKYYKVANYVSGRIIGYVNYYYKSGKLYFQTPLKSIDPDVYMDGEIKYFSESGERIKILNYQNGILNGQADYFYPDGKPYVHGYFTDNKRTGIWKQWDEDGKYGIGGFVNDLPQGKWTFYYSTGSIRSEGKFNNGIQSGIWTEYRENGDIAEGSYVNGKPNGTWVGKYSNQKPCFIGSYKNGIKEGFWKEWDITGRLSQGNYTNNIKDGLWTWFDAKGRKVSEGSFANGIEDGQWNKYDIMGNIIETIFYKDGQRIEQ